MKYGGAGAALDGAKDVVRHANQVLSGLPLVQHAFWVILGAPMAQTICERGNSAARHLLDNWRNLGRIRLECGRWRRRCRRPRRSRQCSGRSGMSSRG